MNLSKERRSGSFPVVMISSSTYGIYLLQLGYGEEYSLHYLLPDSHGGCLLSVTPCQDSLF